MATNNNKRSSDQNASNWNTRFKDVRNIAKNLTGMALGELAPGIKETTTSANDTIRETRQFISKARNQIGYQSNSINRNTAGRKAMGIIKEAFEDLKSGSFGLDKMGDDSFDMEDDFDANIRDYDSQIKSSANDPDSIAMYESKKNTAMLGKVISHGNATTVSCFGKMTKTVAGVTLKATQAQTQQLTNVMLMSMNAQNSALSMANSRLDTINTNLVNIIEFNNNTAAEFYQQTAEFQSSVLEMMNSIGESIAKMQDIQENKERTDEFDFSNGFNLSTYKNLVKRNFDSSMFGLGKSALGMMGGFGVNPITMALPTLLGWMVPGFIKKPIQRFDRNFTKGMESLLYRLGDMRHEGGIKGGIGELFGKKRESISKMNMSNYKKDAMSWNGVAQRYLTEVIPSYLAKIEAGVTNGPERYYNEGKGFFQSKKDVREEFKKGMESGYETGMMPFTNDMRRILAKNKVKSDEINEIMDNMQYFVHDSVYAKSSKKGDANLKAARALKAQLRDKNINSNDVNDLVITMLTGISDATKNINDFMRDIDNSQRHLFNDRQSTEENFRKYQLGNINTKHRYSVGGLRMDDIDDEDELRRARQELKNEDRSRSEKLAMIARVRYGKNWKSDPRSKQLFKKFGKKDKERKVSKVDQLSNEMYALLSGTNFKDDEDDYGMDQILDDIESIKSQENEARMTEQQNKKKKKKKRKKGNQSSYSSGYDIEDELSEISSAINILSTNTNASSAWSTKAENALVNTIPQKLDKIEKAILKLSAPSSQSNIHHASSATGQSSNTKPTGGGNNRTNLISFTEALSLTDNQLEHRARNTQNAINGGNKGNDAGPVSDNKTSADVIADRLNENEESLSNLVRATNDNFMAPMVGGIFGRDGMIRRFFSKENLKSIGDKLFNEKDGVFKKAGSWFKDQMDYVKYIFTGKGYTNRKGEKFEENKNSVFDKLTNGYDWVYTKTMQHIFGDDYKENDTFNKYFKRFDLKSRREEKRNKRLSEAQGGTTESSLVEDTSENFSNVSDDPKEIDSQIQTLKDKINSGTLGEAGLKKANKELNVLYHKRKNLKKKQGSDNKETTDKKAKGDGTLKSTIQEAGMATAKKIRDAGDNLVNNVIGDVKDSDIKKDRKQFGSKYKETFKKFLPVGIAGAVVGGGIGLLSSMQGAGAVAPLFFSGGPIAGAILGVSATILARSEKFQKVLFGEKQDDGTRKGGLISNKTQNFFKKHAPLLVGGAAIGALKGVFKTATGGAVVGGPGGFLLNSLLPGGILGGAVLGLGVSLLKSSDRFTGILFGKKGEKDDSKKSTSISQKLKQAFSKSGHFLKGGAKGAAIGAGAGLALNSMGVMGGALSIGGPIGMGILGLGMGIASQADRVKSLLFGTEEFDEDGKSKGRRKNGLFPRMRNYLVMNVFEPLKDNLQEKTEDFAFWIKKKITYPFRLAFGPIIDSFREIRKDIADTIKNTFNNVADAIGKTVKSVLGVAFKPVTKAFKNVGQIMTNVAFSGMKLALSPLSIGLNIMKFGTRRLRKKAKGERTKTLFQHAGDIYRGIKDATANQWANDERDYGAGPIGAVNKFFTRGRDVIRNTREGIWTAKKAYNEGMKTQGFNSLGWMDVPEERKRDKELRKMFKKDRKWWKGIDEERRAIANENEHKELFLTEDQLDEYRKRLKKAGFKHTNFIQNSSDLNDLLYNKDDFIERIKNNDPKNKLRIPSATEHFYTRTYKYQDEIMSKFDYISKMFTKYATQNAVARRKNLSIKNLGEIDQNLSEAGLTWEDIGVEPGSLADITTISDEDWETYQRDRLNPENADKTLFNDFIRDILKRQKEEAEKEGSPTEQIVERLDTLNEISEANARMNASEQMNDTGATTSEIEKAAGHDLGDNFDDPITRHKKEQEKAARKSKEDAESEKARSGHRSYQDGDKDKKDKDDEEDDDGKKKKEKDKNSTLFGDIWDGFTGLLGGIGGLFTKEGFWKAAGITTIAAATFGPWAKDVFSKVADFLEPVTSFLGEKIKDGATWLVANMPDIVAKLTNNIVDNMGLVVDSLWTIASTMTKEVGKRAINGIFHLVGLEGPFKDTESKTFGSDKSFETEEEAQNYANLTGMNVSASGTEVLGENTVVDTETGETSYVSNGSWRRKGVATRAATQAYFNPKVAKNLKTVGKYTVKAANFVTKLNPVTRIVTSPLRAGARGVSQLASGVDQAELSFGAKLIKKVLDALKSFGNILKKKFKKHPKLIKGWSKVCESVNKLLSSEILKKPECLKALSEKLTKKVSIGVLKATPLGLAFAAYDAINGAVSAAYLFGIEDDKVTGYMRTISSVLEALFGSSFGIPLSVTFEVIKSFTGKDCKQWLARTIYSIAGGDKEYLQDAIDEFELECKKYNTLFNANLTVENFNETVNSGKTLVGRATTAIGWKKQKIDTSELEVTESELAEFQKEKYGTVDNSGTSSSGKTVDDYVSYSGTDNYDIRISDSSNVGMGPGDVPSKRSKSRRAIGYGIKQNDPRWANMPLGTFPSGRVSTMATGGCGPTALSMVANKDPVTVAKDARSGGYIKDGGATSGLFTEGAKKYGLHAQNVSRSDLENNLKSGKPTILSGNSDSDGPYTKAGHVIVASGMDNAGNAIVNDPMRGTRKVKTSELSKGMTHGWSYSSNSPSYGSGNAEDDVAGYGGTVGMNATSAPVMTVDVKKRNKPKFFKYNGKRYKAVKDAKGNDTWQEMSWYEFSCNYSETTPPADFDPTTALAKGAVAKHSVNIDGKTYNETYIKNLANSDTAAGKQIRATYSLAENSKVKKSLNIDTRGSKSTKEKAGIDDKPSFEVMKMSEYGQFLNENLKKSGVDSKAAELAFANKFGYAPETDQRLQPGMGPNALLESVNHGTLNSQQRIIDKINQGYQISDGEYKFNTASFYSGLKVADLKSMAEYDSALLTDTRIPKFKAIYKYYVKSGRYSIDRFLKDKEIESIFGRADFIKSLGGHGTEGNYEYKYGFPFFQTADSRWGDLEWRGSTVKSRGGDLASLAMVATAFGPNILDPEYIYDKWLEKHEDWYDKKTGLKFDKVLAEDGYPAQKSGKVNGKSVLVKQLKNANSILSYLKANKPVIMTGYRYSTSPFGGYYARASAPLDGPDDYATIVARAANDSHMAVLNPYTTRTQNGVFDVNSLTDTVGKGSTKAVKEAYGITGPSGGGISGKVDLRSKGNQDSDYIDLSKEKGLDKIIALFKNIASIGLHMFDAILGGEDYISIYDSNENAEGGIEEDDNGNGEGANLDGYNAATKSSDVSSSGFASANLSSIDYNSLPYGSSSSSIQNAVLQNYGSLTNSSGKANCYKYHDQYYLQMGTNKYMRISEEQYEAMEATNTINRVWSIPHALANGTATIYGAVSKSYAGGGTMGRTYSYLNGTASTNLAQSYQAGYNTRLSPITTRFTSKTTKVDPAKANSKDTAVANKVSNFFSRWFGGGNRDLVYGEGDVVGYGPTTITKASLGSSTIPANIQALINKKNRIGKLTQEEEATLWSYQRNLTNKSTKSSSSSKKTTSKNTSKKSKSSSDLPYGSSSSSIQNPVLQNSNTGNIQMVNSDYSNAVLSGQVQTSDAQTQQIQIPEIQQYSGGTNLTARKGNIEYLAMHYTTSPSSEAGSARNVCSWWTPGVDGSADFVVDDGEIWQYNPDPTKNYTWAVGDNLYSSMTTSLGGTMHGKASNQNTISIEMQSSNKTGKQESDPCSENWYFTEEVLNNAAGLASKLMKDYNIPQDHLIMHHHVSGKVCPGPWARNEQSLSEWEAFKQRVANGSSGVTTSGTATSSTTTTTDNVERDFSKLPASVRMSAIMNASIAAAFGDDYETAKQHYLEAAYDEYFGSPTSTTTTTTSTGTTGTTLTSSSGNVNLDPNNVPQSVWNYFISKGYSPYGTAGIMGNMNHESGMIVNRKQGDFSNGYIASAQYTQAADSGSINFANDSIGYGLVQFTYHTLKQSLLDRAKSEGKSVGDLGVQLDEIDSYLNSNGLASRIKTATSVTDASNIFLHEYERPADQSYAVEQIRASAGESFYNQFANSTSTGYGPGPNDENIIQILNNRNPMKYTPRRSRAVGYGGNWLQIVADIKKLVAEKQAGYNQSGFIDITYNNETKSMRQDCSGYVGLCLYHYGVPGMYNTWTGCYYPGSSPMDNSDFTYMSWPGRDNLLPGDILIDQQSHVEVYAGNGQSYSAGSKESINNPGTNSIYRDYPGIWRPKDAGSVNGTTTGSATGSNSTSTTISSTTGSVGTYMDPFTRMMSGLSSLALQTSTGRAIAFGPGDTGDAESFFTKTLGGNVSSLYGRRSSQLGNEFHRGMDIEAPEGQEIYSPVSGEVVATGNDVAGYGNYSVIRDGKGKNHIFAHMKNSPVYGVGDSVNQFDVLGEVGSTGKSTGSHLHYEIRNNGNKYSTIDPSTYSYDSEASKSMNIHRTNQKATTEVPDTASVGSGSRDISASSVQDKLNVAINTDGIEGKMDAMIEALQLMVENTSHPQAASSSITQNTSIVYGSGDKKSKTTQKTVEKKNDKSTRENEILAGMHKMIAKRG